MCFNEATFLFACSVLLSHSACSPLTQVGGLLFLNKMFFPFSQALSKWDLTLIIVGLSETLQLC